MTNTDTVGLPLGSKPSSSSRTSEFQSAGAAHTMQQNAGAGGFRPDSVITPVMPTGNGLSTDTLNRQRVLNAYR